MADNTPNSLDSRQMDKENLTSDLQLEIDCLTLEANGLKNRIEDLEWELQQTKIDCEHQAVYAISGFISTVTLAVILLLTKYPNIEKLLSTLLSQMIDSIF